MIYNIDEIMFSIADNIEATMERKKINTKTLAKKMGVYYTTVWNHKSGRRIPNLESLLRLCNALDVDLNELLGVAHEGR